MGRRDRKSRTRNGRYVRGVSRYDPWGHDWDKEEKFHRRWLIITVIVSLVILALLTWGFVELVNWITSIQVSLEDVRINRAS